MTQTRLGSIYEVCINTVIGFVINYVMNIVIFVWIFGKDISLTENFYIGLLFTVVSVARSYVIRRWFNAKLHALAERMAA